MAPDWSTSSPADIHRVSLAMRFSTNLVGPPVVGLLIDWALGWFQWFPLATLIGLALAFLLTLYQVVRLARKLNKSEPDSTDGRKSVEQGPKT